MNKNKIERKKQIQFTHELRNILICFDEFFLNKKGKFQGWQYFAEEMCKFLSFFFFQFGMVFRKTIGIFKFLTIFSTIFSQKTHIFGKTFRGTSEKIPQVHMHIKFTHEHHGVACKMLFMCERTSYLSWSFHN